jgi:DNA-directed RNA polymerase II subunit RPB2
MSSKRKRESTNGQLEPEEEVSLKRISLENKLLLQEDLKWWKHAIRDDIFSSVIKDVNMTEHHTLPFDDLLNIWLGRIISTYGTTSTVFGERKYNVKMSNYKFVRNDIRPSDAHTFNISYAGTIYIDIHEQQFTKEYIQDGKASGDPEYPWVRKDEIHHNRPLCDFPIMLLSAACHITEGYDLQGQSEPEWGGGFIVKGKRRFIPMLKTLMNNYAYRFYNKNKGYHLIQVRSVHLDRQHRSTSTLEVVMDDVKARRSTTFHNAYVKIPFLVPVVPLTVMIQAFGWEREAFIDVTKAIMGTKWNDALFRKYVIMFNNDTHGCTTRDQSLGFINKLYGKPENVPTAAHILRSEVLPHLSKSDDVEYAKGYYIAYMFSSLIMFREGLLTESNRDSFLYTRLTDSATSLAVLFRMQFLMFIKQGLKIMRRVLNQDKEIVIEKIYNESRLTQKIMSALATGTWSKKRKGVSHPMTTTNDEAILSQLRRISSSYLNNDGKHVVPRMVQSDSHGYTCAAETPEGEGCGLIYSLASTARVTRTSDQDALMEVLILEMGDNYVKFPTPTKQDTWYTFFDGFGRITGFLKDIGLAIKTFLRLRRSVSIDPFVGYFKDEFLLEFRVFCDIGRLIRPLIVVENMHKIPTIVRSNRGDTSLLHSLVAAGCVEYVSAAEEMSLTLTYSFSDVFSQPGMFSHLEITDVSFVGIIAALSPYFRHNQGPRLVYWIGMSKQAIGCTTKDDMGAATTHNLWYGQSPLVNTKTAHILGMDQTATCINCTVIFFPLDYNQEDALVFNQASIDRGMFISNSVRTYDALRNGNINDISGEKFERPRKGNTFGMKMGSYDVIRKDGLSRPGEYVSGGDIIIGKTVPVKKISSSALVNVPRQLRTSEYQRKRHDKSIQVRSDEKGVVSRVQLAHKQNSDIAKVQVRTVRIPEIGDKFSSRFSQKGVVGRLERPESLPFSMMTGMIPDVVMSPLGFPSRMTMGKLLEIMFGKGACLTGNLSQAIDEQKFDEPSEIQMDEVKAVLREHGFSDTGKETFICGITGKMIKVPVMCGMVSYVKLNHMVSRKTHARATGPVHILTRQPNEGRRQNGGLRFGQMESEAVTGHGASEVLRERTLTVADKFKLYVCATCGFIADGNKNIGLFFCRYCRSGKDVKTVIMPHTAKLMNSELNATGVKVKLELTEE